MRNKINNESGTATVKTSLWAIMLLLFAGCTSNTRNMEIHYLQEGKLCSENIALDFIDENGNIRSPYIDSVKFSILDSLVYPENNPDRDKTFSTPVALDFSKKIKPYSPEYYTAYTVHNIIKVMEYYNRLFDNKIDFNSQKEYKTIECVFGDVPLFTHPNIYIFEPNSNPSPTVFSHEIGHRAFWYIEDSLGIEFKGLSVIHMGLLEYFTMSLYNSPVVGEDCLPVKLIRNAEFPCKYPLDSTFSIRNTFRLVEESYPEKINNPQSNISKYLAASYASYGDFMAIHDNHRGGMVLASTLWRIRKQIGQEKTDKLVAQTILNLNSCFNERLKRYPSSKIPPLIEPKIEWYDVFYGLIQKDRELFEGEDIQIIENEFTQTGYPIYETIRQKIGKQAGDTIKVTIQKKQ